MLIPARNVVQNAKARTQPWYRAALGDQRIARLAAQMRAGDKRPEDLTSPDRELVAVYFVDHPRRTRGHS